MNTVRGNGRLYQVCKKPYHRNSIYTKQTQERSIDGAALSVDGANRSIARDKCAIDGSIDGAALSVDGADPSIARDSGLLITATFKSEISSLSVVEIIKLLRTDQF